MNPYRKRRRNQERRERRHVQRWTAAEIEAGRLRAASWMYMLDEPPPRRIDWSWVAQIPFTRRFDEKGVTLPGGKLIPWEPGELERLAGDFPVKVQHA